VHPLSTLASLSESNCLWPGGGKKELALMLAYPVAGLSAVSAELPSCPVPHGTHSRAAGLLILNNRL